MDNLVNTCPDSGNVNPKRCDICLMLKHICICNLYKNLPLKRSSLSLIVHYREWRKPTNTGRIAVKCLNPSRTIIRGLPESQFSTTKLSSEPTPGEQKMVLFPSENAVELTPDLAKKFDRIHLIVPDGNWPQAARIPKREPLCQDAMAITLPPGPLTTYRLRREARRTDGLATIEAIARAMKIIESEEVANELIQIFDEMVERTLESRGMARKR